MELFEEDFYQVINPNIRISILDFFVLYQPIIGQNAAALYLTLLSESERDSYIEHRRLTKIMNLSIDEIQDARELLEQYSLMKCYFNENTSEYIYYLLEPLTADKFLSHAVYGLKYQNTVGLNEFERAKVIYSAPHAKLTHFRDISRKLDRKTLSRISEEEVRQFIDSKDENLSADRTFGFNSEFDYESFIKPLTNLMFPFELRTNENLRFIGRLSSVTNMEMSRLRTYVCQAVDTKNNTFDRDKLLRKVLKDSKIAVEQDLGYSADPFSFLLHLQEGVSLSKTSRMCLEYLVNDTSFSTEVINIMLEYILQANNNMLNLNYVQAVAETFARNNVRTEAEAQTLVKKLRKQSKTSAQRQKKIHQPSLRKETAEESEEEKEEALKRYTAIVKESNES